MIDEMVYACIGIITALAGNTTDRCYGNFDGTSSSAPLVAGVVALVLGARPDLTWRDVQYVIMKSADRNDPLSEGTTIPPFLRCHFSRSLIMCGIHVTCLSQRN
jgi:hypothetical protein